MDQIFQDRTQNMRDDHRAGRTHLDHIDSQILSVFPENEFQSVRTLAPKLRISWSAVHRKLTQALGFRLRHTGLLPLLLTDELKAESLTSAAEMLRILMEQEVINCADIITGDESLNGSFSTIPEIMSGCWTTKTLQNASHKQLILKCNCSQAFAPLAVR
jgi:hypothetical protein